MKQNFFGLALLNIAHSYVDWDMIDGLSCFTASTKSPWVCSRASAIQFGQLGRLNCAIEYHGLE